MYTQSFDLELQLGSAPLIQLSSAGRILVVFERRDDRPRGKIADGPRSHAFTEFSSNL